MSDRTRVLITCVGSGIGQSVVDSLKHRKDEFHVVGSDRNRFSFPVPDCDDFVSLPPIDDHGYVDALLRSCRERRIQAAIPGHDMELALFARSRARLEAAGTRPIVANESLVGLLRDKRAWSREFGRLTGCVVPCIDLADVRAGREAIEFPAIAKPVSGSASAGLRILRRVEDLEGLPEDCIVQRFLFPTSDDPEYELIRGAVAAGRVIQASEISVQLAYSRDGELLARFASRNRLKAGVPVEFHPVDSKLVWSAVEEVMSVLERYEPSGPINMQGRITDRGLVFFEMNPRFTGITGNRAQFGFNEVALLVDSFVAGARRALRTNPRKVGVRQVACRAWPRDRFHFGEAAAGDGQRAIVVLGGTSWLAREFAARRVARGDAVVIVCRDGSAANARRGVAGLPGIEVVESGSRALPDCLAWADVVVNCLSGRPPHGAVAIVAAHLEQMRLLDMVEAAEVPLLVNISSQSVYGDGAGDRAESSGVDGSEPYAFSKISIEETVRGLSRRKPSIASVSLRCARLFGAADGLRREEFPHRVIEAAVRDAEIDVRKPLTSLDLLDVRDCAAAIDFFVDAGAMPPRGEVYNVGSGAAVAVAHYLAVADSLCRRRFGRPLRLAVREEGGVARPAMDTSKFRAAGWAPALPLERSVADLFEYFTRAS